MPWEESEDYIRSGHGDAEDAETCRTINLSEPKGLKAIYCKSKTDGKWRIQSYLFSKEDGWTMEKAKEWFAAHRQSFEQSFSWAPSDSLEALRAMGGGKVYLVRSPHVGRTLAADSFGNVHEYDISKEELVACARTGRDRTWNLNHGRAVDAITADGEFEDDAVESIVYCWDDEINKLFAEGKIKHVSPEWDARSVDKVDGLVPKGLVLTGFAFLTDDQVPGDGLSTIELLQMLPAEVGDNVIVSKSYLQAIRSGQATQQQQQLSDEWIANQFNSLKERIEMLQDSVNRLWNTLYDKRVLTVDGKPQEKLEPKFATMAQVVALEKAVNASVGRDLKTELDNLKKQTVEEFKQSLKISGQFQDPILGLNDKSLGFPLPPPSQSRPKKKLDDRVRWQITQKIRERASDDEIRDLIE